MLFLIVFSSLFFILAQSLRIVFPNDPGLFSSATPNTPNSFLRHNDINAYLQKLAREYPLRVDVSTLTRTSENRDLMAITIGNGLRYNNPRYILVNAGLQGYERISPPIAVYIIHQLVEKFKENSALLRGYVWIIVPVVNPDGYEYSHTHERMWQKSRRHLGRGCFGVDLDRNFDFFWAREGIPNEMSPCSPSYRGPNAFSEPETRALRDLIFSLSGKIRFYLTLQSDLNSTQRHQLLYPWRFSSNYPPQNQRYLSAVARAGADAILRSTLTEYKVGMESSVNKNRGGSSMDYALGNAGIPIVIKMALPKSKASTQNIQDILSEAWTGVKAMARQIGTLYNYQSEEDATPIWSKS